MHVPMTGIATGVLYVQYTIAVGGSPDFIMFWVIVHGNEGSNDGPQDRLRP